MLTLLPDGGYSTRHNGLASAYPGFLAISVCTIQWWLFGYTLTYGIGGLWFGDFSHIAHINVWAEPYPGTTVAGLIFSLFQLIFEATVAALTIGGFAERGRILPMIPFIFVSYARLEQLYHDYERSRGF